MVHDEPNEVFEAARQELLQWMKSRVGSQVQRRTEILESIELEDFNMSHAPVPDYRAWTEDDARTFLGTGAVLRRAHTDKERSLAAYLYQLLDIRTKSVLLCSLVAKGEVIEVTYEELVGCCWQHLIISEDGPWWHYCGTPNKPPRPAPKKKELA